MWIFPQPAIAYVKPIQTFPVMVVAQTRSYDGRRILQSEQNIQKVNENTPIIQRSITQHTNAKRNGNTSKPKTEQVNAKSDVSKTQGSYSGRDYSKDETKALIISYSAEYGIDAALPLRVANCESGYNPSSKNKNSTASGVGQFIASTWANTESGKAGISVFDADANTKELVKKISQGGISAWNASRNCWNH